MEFNIGDVVEFWEDGLHGIGRIYKYHYYYYVVIKKVIPIPGFSGTNGWNAEFVDIQTNLVKPTDICWCIKPKNVKHLKTIKGNIKYGYL